ncbi:UDP-N-acetylmuramoyl-tripeptide--D-alanyl-D-alanine ligase [bacterium]|nr:UDP-N-acetylmuramoyl-tripeptide--D-alanyl-D-alanine ligase [bacterium]
MQTQAIYEVFKNSSGVSTDTRKIEAGQLFFALSGPNFNANKFAAQALEKGAIAAVVDDEAFATDERYFLVDDCLLQLQALANHHRNQLNCTVIAVGGSNGKTTSKELIARVLATEYPTFYTPGNYNNHIGVPLSLLMLQPQHEYAVIEMGANHPNEHSLLCQIAEPDFGLITNNGKDHLEGFGSLQGVIDANREIYTYLELAHKAAFVNGNDEVLMHNAEHLARIVYGQHKESLCESRLVAPFPFTKVSLTFYPDGKTITIDSQLFGSFQKDNLSLAACIGYYFDVPLPQIKTALESYRPANMRTQKLAWHGNEILLDAYNANPSSMMAVLSDFCDFEHPKKAVILGDMLEMGDASFAEHQAVVDFLARQHLDFVALVGSEFAKHQHGGFHYFGEAYEVSNWLRQNNFAGYSVLIKGSRGLQLEKILE